MYAELGEESINNKFKMWRLADKFVTTKGVKYRNETSHYRKMT
jgi:hypothetical protein